MYAHTVEGRVKHTTVVAWSSETTTAAAVEEGLAVYFAPHRQRAGLNRVDGRELAVRGAGAHLHELLLHRLRGDQADALQVQRLEDVFVEIVVQGQAGRTLKQHARPVDVDLRGQLRSRDGAADRTHPVSPLLAGLMDQGLQEAFEGVGHLVEARPLTVVHQLRVHERVTEAGWWCQHSHISIDRRPGVTHPYDRAAFSG